MPRFIAKPVVVEAHQYMGGPMPMNFQIAIVRKEMDGAATVATNDGPRLCRHRDWIVRGADGGFTVAREAAFEVAYEPIHQDEPASVERVKRPYVRRNHENV